MKAIFKQETTSINSFTNKSLAFTSLIPINDISEQPYQNSFVINDLEHFIIENNISSTILVKDYLLTKATDEKQYNCIIDIFHNIEKFIKIVPKLPSTDKTYNNFPPLQIPTDSTRADIIKYLESMKEINPVADLAFYSYRQIDSVEKWQAFLVAAWQRNPVSLKGLKNKNLTERYDILKDMNNQSIYEEPNRLALPDEVWNFGTGDGLEKIILLANTLINNDQCYNFTISIKDNKATLNVNNTSFTFDTLFTP